MTDPKIQGNNLGGVNNSGKLKKAENQKLDYQKIEWAAVENLNNAQKLKLIEAVKRSLEKSSNSALVLPIMGTPRAVLGGMKTLVEIQNLLDSNSEPQKPHGLVWAPHSASEIARTVKTTDSGFSKLIELLSTLDDSQKKAIVEYIELEKSLKGTPAKDVEVKEAPKE
jgi:hypothetical protein